MSTPWDQLADKFDTYKKEVWNGAADNIDAVWPIVIDYLKQHFPNPKGKEALEFGCGTGMFCLELHNLGFDVSGIDISAEMIKIAKSHISSEIKLLAGDTKDAKPTAEKEGLFDVITAIMAFQFVNEAGLTDLAESVAVKGHIIFAVHSPEQLEVRRITNTLTISEAQVSVPIYKRAVADYDSIFTTKGFTKTLEISVKSSPKFLKEYKIIEAKEVPKYLILAYQKTA
jgi:2-polyprenyl-3-methyl-5-hydroxy-6-metoxy-1,4-benzoquinol methylase